jgi:hypothetical protein
MSRTTASVFVGLGLGLTAAFGSFTAFVIVLAFTALGLAVGLVLDGRIDLQAIAGRNSEKR